MLRTTDDVRRARSGSAWLPRRHSTFDIRRAAMTQEHARTAANVLLGLTGAAAGYIILRHPAVRRAAWRLARTALTATLPGLLAREIGQAWAASARA
jgi:hypothetical protein